MCASKSKVRPSQHSAPKTSEQENFAEQDQFSFDQRTVHAGLPCANHGCCEHHLLIRPKTSDILVLQMAIAEYRGFLDKLQPHFEFKAILDAGGNVGYVFRGSLGYQTQSDTSGLACRILLQGK